MNILFVCTGNTCRSPMAEALLKDMAKEKDMDIKVRSAGIFAQPGQQASRGTIEALRQEGINIQDSHKANMISIDMLEEADLILTMGISHKKAIISSFKSISEKVYTLWEYAYGIERDIDDPFGGSIDTYISTKKEIKKILKDIIKKLSL